MLGRNHRFLVEFCGIFLQEMAEKQGYFRGAFAQRRHVDREYVEAIVEILAEAARLHRLLNFDVRCRQHADVDVNQMAAAQA